MGQIQANERNNNITAEQNKEKAAVRARNMAGPKPKPVIRRTSIRLDILKKSLILDDYIECSICLLDFVNQDEIAVIACGADR